MSDDVRKVDCPEACSHRGREHVHLEASDGCGQIWGVDDDGRPTILDPFDLERKPPVTLMPVMPRKG